MSNLETLELRRFPNRALLMATAALAAFSVDFVTKNLAVALEPDSLLFHVSDRAPLDFGSFILLHLLNPISDIILEYYS